MTPQNSPEEVDKVLLVLKQEGELSVLRSFMVPPLVLRSFVNLS